jgi:diamine N-acetyltransferase
MQIVFNAFLNNLNNSQHPSTFSTFSTKKMPLTLRRAAPDDLPMIRAMAQRIWRAHYPEIIGLEQVEYMLNLNYTEPRLLRQMREEGQDFWIPQDGNSDLGYLSVSDQGGGRYFLHKFYIDNTQRGHGVGAAAFKLLLAEYPGLSELRLTVNRQNYKSINFYFKMGFTIEHCVDIPIGQGFIMDDFQMLLKFQPRGK